MIVLATNQNTVPDEDKDFRYMIHLLENHCIKNTRAYVMQHPYHNPLLDNLTTHHGKATKFTRES